MDSVIKQWVIAIFISCTLPWEDNNWLGHIKMFLNAFSDMTTKVNCKNF